MRRKIEEASHYLNPQWFCLWVYSETMSPFSFLCNVDKLAQAVSNKHYTCFQIVEKNWASTGCLVPTNIRKFQIL